MDSKKLKTNNPFVDYFPPGHYYSPLPDLAETLEYESAIWNQNQEDFPGINLNIAGQLQLLQDLSRQFRSFPFPPALGEKFRYHHDNSFFPRTDGTIYHLLLQHWQPNRVIEIGSGFSSALLLDTKDHFLNQNVHCTFVEPDCRRLRDLLGTEESSATILECKLQDCDISIFDSLEANDILFIDSSHVAKIGSDVTKIFFEILPRLKAGVHVHIHDIYHPFEYPKAWLEKGWAWNEAYMLRAFLQFNDTFEISLWNRFMTSRFYADIPSNLQTDLLPTTGGSIWLRKRR